MPPPFPDISPSGSVLIAWQLKKKRVLIVGGGNVAADRIRSILVAYDAASQSPQLCLVCPMSGLNAEVRYRLYDAQEAPKWNIQHIDRNFDPALDLPISVLGLNGQTRPDMVLTALDDPEISQQIHALCVQLRIPVNVADVPPLCDFYFGSVIKRGPLQILVSTNGKSPRLANRIRRQIESSLPANVGEAIEQMGQLRADLRKKAPNEEDGKRRMEWMIKVTDKWSLDDLCELDAEKREKVLSGWEYDKAYSLKDIQDTGRHRWHLERRFLNAFPAIDWISLGSGCLIGSIITTFVLRGSGFAGTRI